MSLLSVVIMFLSFAAGLFAIREIKILAEGDVERYQVVRAISLITMTIAPYFIPDPWNNVAVTRGIIGARSLFLPETERLLVIDGNVQLVSTLWEAGAAFERQPRLAKRQIWLLQNKSKCWLAPILLK